MALEEYTSHQEIRAVLGVSEDELDDETLGLDMYYQHLLVELSAIDTASDLLADYATVVEVDESARTAAQAAFFRAVRLFAPHCIAAMLLPSIPLLAQRAVTDGKAGITRFSGEPYKATIARVQAAYERLRTNLVAAYAALQGGTATTGTSRPYMLVSTPTSDPVLGT